MCPAAMRVLLRSTLILIFGAWTVFAATATFDWQDPLALSAALLVGRRRSRRERRGVVIAGGVTIRTLVCACVQSMPITGAHKLRHCGDLRQELSRLTRTASLGVMGRVAVVKSSARPTVSRMRMVMVVWLMGARRKALAVRRPLVHARRIGT